MAEETLEEPYSLKKIWLRSLNCALGSFSFGYANGIFTSSQPCVSSLLNWGEEKNTYIALMAAIIQFGAMTGCIITGFMTIYMSKKKCLMVTDLIMALGGILFMIPNTISFGLARYISGVAIGCFSMLGPQYLNEFLPPKIRGKFGTLNQMSAMVGLLISFSVCQFLPRDDCSEDMTYYVFALFAASGAIGIIQYFNLTVFFPENSPRESPSLCKAFGYLTTSIHEPGEESDIASEEKTKKKFESYNEFTLGQLLCCAKGSTKAMRVGTLFHFIQQASGINAILSYSTTIFQSFGQGVYFARAMTVTASFLRILSVFGLFAVIEKYGRKKVTIFFTFMMGLSFMVLGIFVNFDGFAVIMVICIDLYLCFFAVSLGPICWIYTSETMTDKGMAFGAACNWGTAALVVWCFPYSVTYIGISSTFLLFSFLNTISAFYFIFDMIETKGLAKEQIREILKNMR